jgi:diaminopimelate epimerase
MSQKPISLLGRTSLTRISVTGNGANYLVRTGDEPPVRVWVRRSGLECECGSAGCAHVSAVTMCGFVESSGEQQAAA